jgi:two-component sensor histidine kinase
MNGPDLTRRLAQREQLAGLGAFALGTGNVDQLLTEVCRVVAAGLGVRFCKFLEPVAAENALLVRAGVGWREGVVGHAKLDADAGSPAGHALKTGEPVLSSKLSEEHRFRAPPLLLEHGIETAMNVIVRGEAQIFGVLEADSRRPGVFDAEDISFMQAAANLLGVGLERDRRDAAWREALAASELLVREADHRLKNSLQLVASLLGLQRTRLANQEAIEALEGAIARVQAVAETHRALSESSDLRRVAFGRILRDLCRHAGEFNPSVTITCSAEGALALDAERAMPLGMIVSEALVNAVRHAYPGGQAGEVSARAGERGGSLVVEIADRGVGYSPDAQSAATGLGAMIIRSLSRQIGAELQIKSAPGQGTTMTLRLPRLAPATGS